MLRIGLTGGIASGKSSVADMFAALGTPIVDSDLIAREIVAPGSPGLSAVRDAFGDRVLAADGTLDRRKVRNLVFADAALRARLEAILHPLIRRRLLARLEEIRADYVVIVVPLLLETDFAALVDHILVVDCPPEVQIARVMQRDALSRPEAEAILGAQIDRATRRNAADDVIDNGGALEATRAQVVVLHERYSAMGRDCPSPRGRAE
ncbi:MAG TPA: dephospho-CoA kinase [Gammaproteobacteria bacterium]